MTHHTGDSDIAAVLIGNKNWTFAVPNKYGDGTTDIYIFDSEEEFVKSSHYKYLDFLSSVQGTFNIYSYDCAFDAPDEEILATLSGRYGIYNGEQTVAFVKWKSMIDM